jgi:hypothetical protein
MSETPRTDAARPPYTELHNFVTADFARTLERELAAMTARAELAERQVAVLATLSGDRMDCLVCPLYADGGGCIDDCDSLLAAWSRAEAEGGKV